ncbi:MAG: FkbM family methyltransferase [Geminicoccaceae bacterium]
MKPREPWAQLVDTLHRNEVGLVVDVGANLGQYARILRREGWQGRILSIEPIPEIRAELAAAAADDPGWTVLPPMAMGDHIGTAILEVSAETDMSSLLPQNDLLREVSPSSHIERRIAVPLQRLDALPELRDEQRLFLKLDVQGAEPQALAGAEGLMGRVIGLQVEMALVPVYAGERLWTETIGALGAAGFDLHLLIPGYYERKLGRQLQVDGVFYR